MSIQLLSFVVLTVSVCVTAALQCKYCEYYDTSDLPSALNDLSSAFGGSSTSASCVDNAASVTSITCPAVSSGKRAVCFYSKGHVKATFEFAGQRESFKFTTYDRGCHHVDADAADEGEIPTSEFSSALNEVFDWINGLSNGAMTASLSSLSGTVKYCSTDSCGSDEDLAELSGSAAATVTMMTMAAALLVARIF